MHIIDELPCANCTRKRIIQKCDGTYQKNKQRVQCQILWAWYEKSRLKLADTFGYARRGDAGQ